MSFLDIFVLFVLVIIAFLYIKQQYGEVEYVKSNVDDRKYLVLKLQDKQDAADTLATLNKDMVFLIKHLKKKYPDMPQIKRLVDNYNENALSEGDVDTGYTSYTINKGKMILCIRQKDKTKTLIKDINLLRYVIIHEISHLATKSIGHTPQFWKNFKFILNEAVEIGVYKKTDYAKDPRPYCGIRVTSSII